MKCPVSAHDASLEIAASLNKGVNRPTVMAAIGVVRLSRHPRGLWFIVVARKGKLFCNIS